MLVLNNQDRIFSCVVHGLMDAISAHGPIYKNRKSIRSAAKRILGHIKTDVHNFETRNIKRVRVNGEYVEIDNQ